MMTCREKLLCILLLSIFLTVISTSMISAETSPGHEPGDDDEQGPDTEGDTFTYDGIEYHITSIEKKYVRLQNGKNCTGEITLPSAVPYKDEVYNVKTIRTSAFYDCAGITSVTIPSGIISIGGNAFAFCYSLTTVNIPDTVTEIGDGVFLCDGLLESVNISSDNDYYVMIGGVLYSKDLSAILWYPLQKTDTSYTILNGVTKVGYGTFFGCRYLENIVIPNTMTSIGYGAFYNSSITSVNIPDGVTSIGSGAFYCCSSLVSANIPDSVTRIDDIAFGNCQKLSSVTIPSNIQIIGSRAFYDCDLVSVNIPASATMIGAGAFSNNPRLTAITVSQDNSSYFSDNGVLYSKTGILLSYPAGNTSPEYTIRNGTTHIEQYSFSNSTSLKAIVIPDGVTYIGTNAFERCTSLEYIRMPGSVATVKPNAFSMGHPGNEVLCRVDNYTSFDLNDFANDYTVLIYDYLTLDMPTVVSNEYTYDSNNKSIVFDGDLSKMIVSGNEQSQAGTYNVKVSIKNTYIYKWTNGTQDVLDYTLIINQKQITVKAKDHNIAYYGAVPCYTADFTGLISGDYYDYTTECGYYVGGKGEFQILISGLEKFGNYKAEFVNGKVTVNESFTADGYGYRINDGGQSVELVSAPGGTVTVPDNVRFLMNIYMVTTVSDDAFNIYVREITFGHNVRLVKGSMFDGYTSLQNISVVDSNSDMSAADGILFNRTQTVLIRCPIDNSTTDYTVPTTVTLISDGAFDGCNNIRTVTITENITDVGKYPFRNCASLTDIFVSEDSRTYISYGGILYNDISVIRCPEGKSGLFTTENNPSITSVKEGAFLDCILLTEIYLGDRISIIEDDAFKGCSALTIKAFGISDTVCTGIDKSNTVKAYVTAGSFTYSDGTQVNNVKCSQYDVFISDKKIDRIYMSLSAYSVKINDNMLNSYYGSISTNIVDSVDLNSYISAEEHFDEPSVSDGRIRLTVLGSSFSITFLSGNNATTLKYGEEKILHGDIPDPYTGAPKGCIAYWPDYELDMTTTQKVNAVFESYLNFESYSGTDTMNSGTVMVVGLNSNIGKWYSHLNSDLYIDIPNTATDGSVIVGIKAIEDGAIIKINIGSNVHDISPGAFSKCKALKTINVANDNPTYKTVNSSLLSYDGKILCAVPYNSGSVYTVPDSVTEIDSKALCGNVHKLLISSARDIQFNTGCNSTGHSVAIDVAAGSNIKKMSADTLESDNAQMTLTVEKKDDPLADNIGLTGNIVELVILIVCAILVFVMIVRMGDVGVNPEQKNLYIPVLIATIADTSMFIYLLLCSQADVSIMFTVLWIMGAVAVIVEVISTYSLYMYQISKDDPDIACTYKKRGRILTYIGEIIGIVSAVILILSVSVLGINVNSNINVLVILISVTYIIVEGLVISTIYRAFDNTKSKLNSGM